MIRFLITLWILFPLSEHSILKVQEKPQLTLPANTDYSNILIWETACLTLPARDNPSLPEITTPPELPGPEPVPPEPLPLEPSLSEPLPPDPSPPEKAETVLVWSFSYEDIPYYWYDQYGVFASSSGKAYKPDTPQEQWIKDGSINICVYNEFGEKVLCVNCKLHQVEVPPGELTYQPTNTGNFQPQTLPPPRPLSMIDYLQRGQNFYPVTRTQFWTHRGEYPHFTHLLEGVHAQEHFDPNWLAALWVTDHKQVWQLHSDCHEGTVIESYVVRTR